MFSLVIIVIAIGLMASIAAATMNYMPVDAHIRQQMMKEADRGIKALDCAVTRYLDAQPRDANGKIAPPTVGVNLSYAVVPQYGFLPANVRKEMTWDVTGGVVSGMPAVGICLRPIAASTAMQREVLSKLQAQLPVDSTFVGSGCNATADSTNGGYLTYWVPVAHVE
jgi:hypothetical protein